METYPVDNSQIAVYLTFTFLSVVVSVCVYCIYNHFNTFADEDFNRLTNFYISVCQNNKESFSEADSVNSGAR
jgi:hypothetical protein